MDLHRLKRRVEQIERPAEMRHTDDLGPHVELRVSDEPPMDELDAVCDELGVRMMIESDGCQTVYRFG